MRRLGRMIRRLGLTLIVAVLGFVLGALTLYVIDVRGGPPLEVWHTVQLPEEFTADRADVRSFEDYQALEERLFAQIDEKVYARVGIGSEFTLVRYSGGSAADPRGRTPDWNRSVELKADAPVGGVVLMHGMSDGPYSFRALAEALNRRGYWVISLRMPGHGTVPAGLTTVTWEDIAATVRMAVAHLAAKTGGKPVHMIGYSTGAPLAVDYTLSVLEGKAAPAPASLVLVSPAIGVTPAVVLAKWISRLAVLPGLEKLAWTQILPEFDPYRYNSFTTNAGVQVHRMTRSTAARIEARAASGPIEAFPPTLVFLSTVDATVSTDAVIDNLLEHLAPGRHELVLFDINRKNIASPLLVADPGPLTARLMADGALPFALTVIENETPESTAMVSRRKPALSAESSTTPLDLSWPGGVISLSHVALPFPPDDPLYGRKPPEDKNALFLGQLAIRGERGLLKLPGDWMLRLRHNPFFEVMERRALEWLAAAGGN